MRRRDFIQGIIASAGWPLAARAQPSKTPLIGMLQSGASQEYVTRRTAFLEGLRQAGFVENRNVTIQTVYANDQYDRLPALAAELVLVNPAVIFAGGGGVAPLAVKAATSTIPIVFTGGFDPVQAGLVASLNRPGGNVTGVTFLSNTLEAKRLSLLHDLIGSANRIAVLLNSGNASVELQRKQLEAAARAMRLEMRIAEVRNERDFDLAFNGFKQWGAEALLVATDAIFTGKAKLLTELAARDRLPAIYAAREFPILGGLMSYGTSFTEAYRQAGTYVGRILRGENPSDLPIVQLSRFEFVINMKTANSLGLTIPNSMQLLADEVIE
jgi:ABC-type uncharacterized transport system substrate-binding protein